jgi:hypothetical protein
MASAPGTSPSRVRMACSPWSSANACVFAWAIRSPSRSISRRAVVFAEARDGKGLDAEGFRGGADRGPDAFGLIAHRNLPLFIDAARSSG